jgi:hypothetical protein
MSTSNSGAHKRKSARKRVRQAMMVTNSFTGESMGRIGNLSGEGMMLIAPKELPEEHYYQVNFAVGTNPNQKIEVGIQALWCDQARAGAAYWVGCKIIDISPKDEAELKVWVESATEVVN